MRLSDDSIQKLRNRLSAPASRSFTYTVLKRLKLENNDILSHEPIGSLALLLRDNSWQVRLSAIHKLRLLAGAEADKLLEAALEDENEFVRMMAAQALEERRQNT